MERPSSRPSHRLALLIKNVISGGLYAGAGWLSLFLAVHQGNITPLWPPAGIAFCALFFFGFEVSPGIWVASFILNAWSFGGHSALGTTGIPFAVLVASAATLQATLGVLLLRRIIRDSGSFDRSFDAFKFLGVALLSCLIAATIGTWALNLASFPSSNFAHVWLIWWLGDAAGVVLLFPVALTWRGIPVFAKRPSQILAVVLFLVLVTIMSATVFLDVIPGFRSWSFPFFLFPLLLWAAFRFRESGTTLTVLIISVVAIWGTSHGLGPFSRAGNDKAFILLQGFLSVCTVMGMCLASILSEHREAREGMEIAQMVAHIGTFEWNIQTGVNKWSPELETMYGLPVGAFPGTQEAWELLVHPEDRIAAKSIVLSAFETEKAVEGEWRVLWTNGSIRWIAGRLKLIRDHSGKPARLTGVNMDVTERRYAEERLRFAQMALQKSHETLEQAVLERTRELRRALADKEVLLKEVHHRVKNNLNIISGLIDLQVDHINTASPAEAFRESQNRIRSIALIHEKLYHAKNVSKIAFGEYAEELVSTLLDAYSSHGLSRNLKIQAEDISLGVDHAIPCALIVHELVSNSLKYAFLGRPDGQISITLKRNPESLVELEVADNGIGFPEGLDYRKTKTLGLQLVVSLTKQLDGHIRLKRKEGTCFKVTFAVPEKPLATVSKISEVQRPLAHAHSIAPI